MAHTWTFVALFGTLLGGCLWERNIERRQTRLQAGLNSRQIAVARPPSSPSYGGGVIARSIEPPTAPDQPLSSGVTGSLQFTLRYLRHVYVGGEIEAGPLERTGSYLGGAYGVVGTEHTSGHGSISLELVGGRRWLRYELGADDVPETVLEPRLRAQLLLKPQITLGAVIGANAMPEERGWMAGLYIGMYSLALDGGR
jgi:hypothetical protein